ncbi:hypothetical protein CCUG60884_00329 [Mycobacteroides salmoniphilum]|uniref:Uncharacterized protein n=2 Tax=Mycobacteroides salmoniphilum TaxID=404941 RepID=A0A4R8SZU7_9MYCO|nr:hypothetical protein CCUG60884_00329 [Mycobacteroides salmoniphilum]
MFLLSQWNGQHPQPFIETLWFTTESGAHAYVANSKVWDPALDHEIVPTQDQPTPDDYRRELVDRRPPEVAAIYTAIWDIGDADPITVKEQRVSAHAAHEFTSPRTTFTLVTEHLHPLTRQKASRWAYDLFARIEVAGVDRPQTEAILATTVNDLRSSDKLITREQAIELAAANAAEQRNYFEPLNKAEHEIHQLSITDSRADINPELAARTWHFFEDRAAKERSYSQELGFPSLQTEAPYLGESPLELANRIATRHEQIGHQWRIAAVRAERARGARWEDIGEALGGISKQTAWNRYATLIGEDKDNDPHIFLVSIDDTGKIAREYWFAHRSPVINSYTVGSVLEQFATDTDPSAPFLIARFLADDNAKLSPLLGTTTEGPGLYLHRDHK